MSSSTSHVDDVASIPSDPLSKFIKLFLDSNLSLLLIIFSVLIGGAALFLTPREEDPQIVVPLADIYVQFPGHSASEVESLVSTPLERILYQIDGVEYVYSMSRENQAIITVRYFVGQDRERSLVKLYKKIDEHLDIIPPGVTGWVVKPVEIDDVPVVTLALKGSDSHTLRRIGEEAIQRLAAVPNVSRAYLVGGEPRTLHVRINSESLRAHQLTPLEVSRAIQGANAVISGGAFTQNDQQFDIQTGVGLRNREEILNLVVGISFDRPVFLKDVADVNDGPAEVETYVRHGWGPAKGFASHHGSPGTVIGEPHEQTSTPHVENGGRSEAHADTLVDSEWASEVNSTAAVTLALSKKKGSNAVAVANEIIRVAEGIKSDLLPNDIELVVTRNYGLTADEKVNELIEALAVAILIVIVLLTLSLGWREAFIVAVAVPVVFGLTLAVNLLFGYTINRVTLFALILSLGLLVDDPIVDVENITRHFAQRKKATREITLGAVAEIRPPLISATLAVIVSFLPLFFITGMMGPYMAPMALNVPTSMLMSMFVAFTITPWLSFHMLKKHYQHGPSTEENSHAVPPPSAHHELYDPEEVKKTLTYRIFKPLMAPILKTRLHALAFLMLIALLTLGATMMAMTRSVPLKMLPFDNKNEFLLVLDFPEGTTLERANGAMVEFEDYFSRVPEVTDFTSYVGTASPIDFNGMVRHYYLRNQPNQAELRVNFVGKKHRKQQSHGIGLRVRNDLQKLAERYDIALKIVELPPGPPVLASVVAEVYGRPESTYDSLLNVAKTVEKRFRVEPGMADVDTIEEVGVQQLVFVPDQEKAALSGVSVEEIAQTLQLVLSGDQTQMLRVEGERQPLKLLIRLPRTERSSIYDLANVSVRGVKGNLVPISELGRWDMTTVDQTIYHKNLQRVAFVMAETVGRPPAECIMDVTADMQANAKLAGSEFEKLYGTVKVAEPRPVKSRTYFSNGSGIAWSVPDEYVVAFAGEGEWKITLDVFRDLGLAFGAAMLLIYVILVAQTGSFTMPLVVMLAIPLTVLGVMPGFWILNQMSGQVVDGYGDPVFFTATGMIGMIALAGIVTRDAIILVDFIELSIARGRSLFDAILESRVVRLRPILLTAGAALLSSLPITLDPIFSGLGWALIFGLVASTIFTLFVIPATFWVIHRR